MEKKPEVETPDMIDKRSQSWWNVLGFIATLFIIVFAIIPALKNGCTKMAATVRPPAAEPEIYSYDNPLKPVIGPTYVWKIVRPPNCWKKLVVDNRDGDTIVYMEYDGDPHREIECLPQSDPNYRDVVVPNAEWRYVRLRTDRGINEKVKVYYID